MPSDEKADKLSEWEREAQEHTDLAANASPGWAQSTALIESRRVLRLIAAVRKYRDALASCPPREVAKEMRDEAEAILAGEKVADAE